MDTKPAVLIREIYKNYRLGSVLVPALKGLSLELKNGDFAALVGSSGSGKTSLLNVIGCLDDFDQGEVFVDGENVRQLSEVQRSHLRSRKIGFIFQSFNLIPVLSAFENVEFPLLLFPELTATQKKQKAEEALVSVGLQDYMKSRPDQLSGGQRQRVAVARALVTSPRIILADEPTANLDSENSHRIIDLMLELNTSRKVTFLFSTHDEKLMGRVKKILRISDGQIQGTAKESL